MSYPTLTDARIRTTFLRGETDYTTVDETVDSSINAAQSDAVLAYPFSWDRTSADLTLSVGEVQLPADYIPKWGIEDLRTADGTLLSAIDPGVRFSYSEGDPVYWISYDTTAKRYLIKTRGYSGTLTCYYHFFPATLTTGTDTLLVPDLEAIALLAASKKYVDDEYASNLYRDYQAQGSARIKDLWIADGNFGSQLTQGSVIDSNSELR